MNRAPFLLVAGAAAAVAFSVTRSGHATDPMDVEVALIAGGGTTPTTGGDAQYVGGLADTREPNPLGVGLGARAGVGIDRFYVGLQGMYNFGSSTGYPYDNVGSNSDLFGADVGYSVKLPAVTIRPLVGVGIFTERTNNLPLPVGIGLGGPAPSSRSYDTLYVQPGITVLVPLDAFFAGADANVLWLQNLPETINGSSGNHSYLSLTFHAQVGARFGI